MTKSKGLGRGLSALLGDAGEDAGGAVLAMLPVASIHPNRLQPRRDFAEPELADLASSIRAKGILQPLTVRRTSNGWELIAGERRLRAATMAGLSEVPCRIMDVPEDVDMLALSLIENLQREDLNPIELAEGFKSLNGQWGLTQEKIAAAVGKDRATIANLMRLLDLPEPVRASLRKGEISVGHAKAILMVHGAARQSALWKKVVSGALTVRQTEQLARSGASARSKPERPPEVLPPQISQFADQLRRSLGTKVTITKRGRRGSIRIDYFSDEDFERLMELLLGGRSNK